MGNVRLADNNPQQYEISGFCRECDEEVYVMPPKKIKDAMDACERGDLDKEYIIYEWSDNKYFCCPSCQKEHDQPEVE